MREDAVRRTEFSEVEDFAAQLCGITAGAVWLLPDWFVASLVSIDLGDLTIQVAHSAPVLLLAAASPGMAGLSRRGLNRLRVNRSVGQPPAR